MRASYFIDISLKLDDSIYVYDMTDFVLLYHLKAFLKKNGIIVHCILFVLPDGPGTLHPAELSPGPAVLTVAPL